MTPLLLAQLAPRPVASASTAAPALTISEVIAPFMAVFFVAFFVSFVATPLMRLLATRNGIVDWPDMARKNHLVPVAYLGGVGIFLGWLAGIALCYADIRWELQGYAVGTSEFPIAVVLGAAVICLTGLFDDVYGISPRVKIGGQLFAAAAIASQHLGQQLLHNAFGLLGLDLPPTLLYIAGTVIIAAFIIGGCNAMNLLDGLDGLASGVAGIAMIGFLLIAAIVCVRAAEDAVTAAAAVDSLGAVGYPMRTVLCLAAIGAILGFLPYNFNPATIFMGDAGSLLLGFLCATTILMFGAIPGQGLLLATAALIVFALPITDTSLAIFRRKLAGQPIFSPDNKHIHHLLRRAGLSVRQSVLVMYSAAIAFAALGVMMVALEWRWRYILAVFVVLYGFIMVTAFKYGQRCAILEAQKKLEAQQAAAAAPLAALHAIGNGSANGNGHAHAPAIPIIERAADA